MYIQKALRWQRLLLLTDAVHFIYDETEMGGSV